MLKINYPSEFIQKKCADFNTSSQRLRASKSEVLPYLREVLEEGAEEVIEEYKKN